MTSAAPSPTPRRALVTGAGGFLGSHLCEHLAANGYRVWACGRLLSGPAGQGILKAMEGVLEVDFPSPNFSRHLGEIQPDLLVHCASSASVPLSMKDPVADFRQSAGIYVDILEAVRSASPSTVVANLSSAAVYGQPRRLPTPEDEPLRPLSPYGFHKRICETLSEEYSSIFGTKILNLRIFSAYGERLYKQVVFDILSKLHDPRTESLNLHGTGNETRDFLHARDIALALQVLFESGRTGTFNVGSGTATRISEVAEFLCRLMNCPKPIRFLGGSRVGDPDRWQADISGLRSVGFVPTIPLEQGLAGVSRWHEAMRRVVS